MYGALNIYFFLQQTGSAFGLTVAHVVLLKVVFICLISTLRMCNNLSLPCTFTPFPNTSE